MTTTPSTDLIAARVLERAATLMRKLVERGRPLTVAQQIAARSDIAERLAADDAPNLDAIITDLKLAGEPATTAGADQSGETFYAKIREQAKRKKERQPSAAERLGLRTSR